MRWRIKSGMKFTGDRSLGIRWVAFFMPVLMAARLTAAPVAQPRDLGWRTPVELRGSREGCRLLLFQQGFRYRRTVFARIGGAVIDASGKIPHDRLAATNRLTETAFHPDLMPFGFQRTNNRRGNA